MSDQEKERIAAQVAAQVTARGEVDDHPLDSALDAPLEELFATARRTRPDAPVALQAAILADAVLLQKTRNEVLAAQQTAGRHSTAHRLWRQFAAAVGGWPAVGGMAAASLTGLWIGLAPPSFLPDPVERFAAFSSGSQLITDLGYDVSLLMGDEVFE
jgi:hypothetical protein